jgi:hypothetical protein
MKSLQKGAEDQKTKPGKSSAQFWSSLSQVSSRMGPIGRVMKRSQEWQIWISVIVGKTNPG